MVNVPYIEKENIRYFSKDVNQSELVWHWDEQDRYISSLNETNWMIQLDNELPQLISKEIFIPKGLFHRLIKGDQNLELKVIKC